MIASRGPAVAAALALAVAAAGCGIGAGEASEGQATLTVTGDYGTEEVLEATVDDPANSDTVLRALDREAEITTRYGGGFVQSIGGLAGGLDGGRSVDWFFYVNGIESPVGSAEVGIEPRDRIWWDHHDWTDVMRVPAVVGSFPQPFESAAADDAAPIEVGCASPTRACDTAAEALEDAGVAAETVDASESDPGERPRMLVGELEAIADDPAAGLLRSGPGRSGVFARVADDGSSLELLDETTTAERSGGLGLVAATLRGGDAPTWVVTGTSPELVAEATKLLDAEHLDDRFAVAVGDDGETIPVPVR